MHIGVALRNILCLFDVGLKNIDEDVVEAKEMVFLAEKDGKSCERCAQEREMIDQFRGYDILSQIHQVEDCGYLFLVVVAKRSCLYATTQLG